jgi:PEGA domain
MKLKNIVFVCALSTIFLHLGGCATILNGDTQAVAFSSEPDNATVKIDGVAMGKTPCVIPVARKGGDKIIEFELNGYKTLIVELDNQIAAAGFGNILFGGIIGVGVDAVSGRAGSYQKSLHIVLESGVGTITLDSKAIQDQKTDAKEKYVTAKSSSADSQRDEIDQSKYSESTQKWINGKVDD